jgi:2-methylcitrate dehydratase
VLEDAEVDRFLDVAQRLGSLEAAELPDVTVTALPGLLTRLTAPGGLF